MDADIWMLVDRLMQWLILPAVGVLWAMNGRVSKQEKEILRILTILEERNHRRDEDREDTSKIFARLYEAIESLSTKIDKIGGLK